jgi:hypothetical protein
MPHGEILGGGMEEKMDIIRTVTSIENPILAGFIRAESGHSGGYKLDEAKTCAASRHEAIFSPDCDKDIVAIFIEDFEKKVAREILGANNCDSRPLLFRVPDAKRMSAQLIIQLASCGDEFSKEILLAKQRKEAQEKEKAQA